MELVREAARSPSVHNVQPARWRFLEDGSVHLLRVLHRSLPVADPRGHDVGVSMGSVFEGMAVALSARGLGLSEPGFPAIHEGSDQERFAEARLVIRPEADTLYAWLPKRRSYRGRFLAATDEDRRILSGAFRTADDVTLATDRQAIASMAVRYDEASYGFVRRSAYQRELYAWMRFRKGSRDWNRDGLNADCMALSPPERWAGAALLYPPVYALLKGLGLGRTLISEAAQIRSAAALLLFHVPEACTSFDAGRRFHRRWLELAAAGFHACPLSALADDPGSNAELRLLADLPPDRRLVNVLRVGRAPAGAVAESPRLPAAELLARTP
jgi:nitroreductase